jgi:phosphatidylglycerol:prolipoprotein diacylglycerol transferase
VIFPEFDPVLLQIGPFALRWYALAYIAGIGLGWWWGRRLAEPRLWGGAEPPITKAQVDDFVLWIAVGIILGGRLGYVLFYQPTLFVSDPLQVLRVWEGGMSFHGGFLGVCIATAVFARVNKVDILRLGDMVAPCVPFGLFFGRLANFINGELWGRVTESPFGMVFCNGRLLEQYGGACPAGPLPRHPSQLYEAALEGVVLFLILFWATHLARLLPRKGAVTGLFLVFYGIFRVAVETVREPDKGLENPFGIGLTMGMALSIPMILVGLVLLLRARPAPSTPPQPA